MPPGVTHPGGNLVLKQPLGTPPRVASAAAATLAPMQRHPHAAGTRWHACHQPRHTRGQGWGVTRTRCPCTPPQLRRLVKGSWVQDGGEQQVPPPILPPRTQCQHPHPAPSPAACAGEGEGRGEAGSCSPQDGWVELNPIWFHYRSQSPEPWLLSSQAREGPGVGGHSITRSPEHPAAPPPAEMSIPPLFSHYSHHQAAWGRGGETLVPCPPPATVEQLKALLGGGEARETPSLVTAGWQGDSPHRRLGGQVVAVGRVAGGAGAAGAPGPGRRGPGAAPCA